MRELDPISSPAAVRRPVERSTTSELKIVMAVNVHTMIVSANTSKIPHIP